VLTVKRSIKGALKLDSAYAVENIRVWIANHQDATPVVPTRHLLDNKVIVVVLGYSLIRSDKLPALAELTETIRASNTTQQIAELLVEQGFVSEEQLGLLQVFVTTQNKVDTFVALLKGELTEDEAAELPPPTHLGESCAHTFTPSGTSLHCPRDSVL
jgi:hypothetical protein